MVMVDCDSKINVVVSDNQMSKNNNSFKLERSHNIIMLFRSNNAEAIGESIIPNDVIIIIIIIINIINYLANQN